MLDAQLTREALGWLRDLSNPPDTSPATPAGQEWLARLNAEMTDAQASGFELVSIAREFSRRGGFFPTPGQIVEAIRERRLKALREERERERAPEQPKVEGPSASDERRLAGIVEWNTTRYNLHTTDSVPAGWASHFPDRSSMWAAAGDLRRRGHRGVGSGEPIAAALDRECRERQECESRGEEWTPPTYGRVRAAAR